MNTLKVMDVFHIVPCFTGLYWRTLNTMSPKLSTAQLAHMKHPLIHSLLGRGVVNWRNTFGGSS